MPDFFKVKLYLQPCVFQQKLMLLRMPNRYVYSRVPTICTAPINVHNGKLDFIWFAKKDNLMLLTSSRLLVSIWMLNMWMEWLLLICTVIRYSRAVELYEPCRIGLFMFTKNLMILNWSSYGTLSVCMIAPRPKHNQDHHFLAIYHTYWIIDSRSGFIMTKQNEVANSKTFFSNKRSLDFKGSD